MNWYHRRVDIRTGERYYEHQAIAEWKIGRPTGHLLILSSQRVHIILSHLQQAEAARAQPLFPIKELLALRCPATSPQDAAYSRGVS